MRSVVVGLAVVTLLASGCSGESEAPEEEPRPTAVSLTGEDRDAFVREVTDLGYTCRDALPETSEHVACTRPGPEDEARYDVVRISSTPDGDQVLRVAYCGAERGVVPAMSRAFLAEVDSPDLRSDPPRLDGVRVTPCRTEAGEGVSLGGPGPTVLRELDLNLLNVNLRRRGWDCGEDSARVDCRQPTPGPGTHVFGIGDQVLVTAPSNRALAGATQALGLSPVVAEAASSCRPGTACEHLVVDGFDLYLSADADYRRLTITELQDF
ncbi:hypothetical protein [Nocardioides lijunqiniae]|uniref:hypothetical protein n=1 Tax=Nocardioides lijunqiniae TaxID=2760832 RepID=UPI001878A173|nr:hypothetical protein [Nocardioides lijunqiniae]